MTEEAREVITRTKLLTILLQSKGSQFIGLRTRTEVKMPKKDNPYHGRVEKVSRITGQIGFVYENSVNTAREREGNPDEFIAGPRKWGKRIEGTPLVEHNGTHYLEVKVTGSVETPMYLLDGVTIPDATVLEPYLREREDDTVIIRAYKLDSIIWFNYDGHQYTVRS